MLFVVVELLRAEPGDERIEPNRPEPAEHAHRHAGDRGRDVTYTTSMLSARATGVSSGYARHRYHADRQTKA